MGWLRVTMLPCSHFVLCITPLAITTFPFRVLYRLPPVSGLI